MTSIPPPTPENRAPEPDFPSEPNLAPLPRQLPFSGWLPLAAGALVGIVLRLIFTGIPGGAYNVMAASFIYVAPFAVGAVTVYVAERQKRRTWGYYVWAPAVATMIFVLGTLVILIEGMICAIIIVPLFALFGAIGGLVMGVICRFTQRSKPAVYSVAVLPLLLGMLPTDEGERQRFGTIDRSIVVQATPEKIWDELHNTRDIRADEVGVAWMYRIGVPLPLAGVTRVTPSGRVRQVTMGKSIHFEQVATAWQENRHVLWTYRFADDSFPPGALDDHVMIGGHFFDLVDTSYTLTPTSPGVTRLNIKMRYRVSTQFNWYADGVARLLIGNFEEVILDFYRQRATRAG
ncbi:MAG: hypothetical protein RLZZ618_310 [Pseudomonadota bacterium]|jgi:hypothetical protein